MKQVHSAWREHGSKHSLQGSVGRDKKESQLGGCLGLGTGTGDDRKVGRRDL